MEIKTKGYGNKLKSAGNFLRAFTLIELLVVIAIIAILGDAAAGAGAREGIRQTHLLPEQSPAVEPLRADVCQRQPGLLSDPQSKIDRWPDKFYDAYGKNLKLLLCPTETQTPISNGGGSSTTDVADIAPRSYFINGWNDYFNETLSADDFTTYMTGSYPSGLKENLIRLPATRSFLVKRLPIRVISTWICWKELGMILSASSTGPP